MEMQLRSESEEWGVREGSLLNPGNKILLLQPLANLYKYKVAESWRPFDSLLISGQTFLSYRHFGPTALDPERLGTFRLNEGFLFWQVSAQLSLELGRKVIPLGTGLFFHPTNFSNFSPQIQNLSEDKEGTLLYRLNWDMGGGTFSGLMISPAGVNNETTGLPTTIDIFTNPTSQPLYEIAYETSWHHADWRASGVFQPEERPRFGLQLSRNAGTDWEWHGEFVWQQGSSVYYPERFTSNGAFPSSLYQFSQTKRADPRTFAQYVIGGQYAADADVTWIFEYAHHDTAYTEEEAALFFEALEASVQDNRFEDPIYGDTTTNPYYLTLLTANQAYQIAHFRQNYGVVSYQHRDYHDTDLSVSFLGNLDDGSPFFQMAATYHGFPTLQLYLEWLGGFGDAHTEFGVLPRNSLFRLKAEWYF